MDGVAGGIRKSSKASFGNRKHRFVIVKNIGAYNIVIAPELDCPYASCRSAYKAGLLFVKGFKVRLWDYTNMRGNFMGILCPLFSVIWFALSIIYYYLAHPFVSHFATDVYNFMFGADGKAANFGLIFALGLVYGIFLIDLVQSIGLFAKIVALAKASPLAARYEELRAESRRFKAEAGERFFEALPEGLQEEILRRRVGPKKPSKLKIALGKILLIDPNRKDKPGDNYDESGRPKKD